MCVNIPECNKQCPLASHSYSGMGHCLSGNDHADQLIRVVLGTPMFLGGVIAFTLDNTVAGKEHAGRADPLYDVIISDDG